MGRKRSPKGSSPQYHATVEYKRAIRARVLKNEWTLKEFAKRVTRAGHKISDEALSQFLGPMDEHADPAPPSNTGAMPAINKALGIAPPPVCEPDSPLAQVLDRIRDRWSAMTETDRRVLMALVRGDDELDLTNDE